MYISVRRGLGDAPSRAPWRVRAGLRPKPQYLAFLKLDQFDWNKASLTPRLREMVRYFAERVRRSWESMQPIAYIRLVGHTDSTTGRDPNYNRVLGEQRARAVKEELENILKEDILKGRIRIAISVDPSPGASAPTADNRTREGRALNRRVEVFVAPPEPQPEPPPQPPPPPPPPQPPVIKTTPGPYPWGKLPTLPPRKTFKQFVDGWLSDHHVPKLVRDQIWKAIFGKNFGLMSSLLDAAGISGPEKEAFMETVRVLAEAQTR
jgi:outer membrane protein OmpA-like peptidoglycan-associated protein